MQIDSVHYYEKPGRKKSAFLLFFPFFFFLLLLTIMISFGPRKTAVLGIATDILDSITSSVDNKLKGQ